MKKNPANLLLTLLAVALLIAFAAGLTSPSITEEAKEAHRNSTSVADDGYDFLFD